MTNTENKKLSITLMLLSSLSFSLMGVMVKSLAHLPTFEAVFFRNLVSFIIAIIITISNKVPLLKNRENLKLLLARAFLGYIGVLAYFYAIQHMALADSAILNRMSPFFVMIFAFFLLKEKITKYQIIALVLAFVGIAFVIRPELDSSILPSLLGFGSAVTAGLAYTLVRMLTGREHPSTIVLYFSGVSVIGTLPLFIIYYVKPSLLDMLFLVLIGVFAAGGQYAMTYSYKYAKASEVSIYSYAVVIFSAVLAFILWGEKISILSIIGIAIVLIASYINYRIIMKKSC